MYGCLDRWTDMRQAAGGPHYQRLPRNLTDRTTTHHTSSRTTCHPTGAAAAAGGKHGKLSHSGQSDIRRVLAKADGNARAGIGRRARAR